MNVVVHTAGPFEGQLYGVAAAVLTGANYIDLADGRAFVAGIKSLDAPSRAAKVTVGLVRAGVLPGMGRLAGPLSRISRRFEFRVSDKVGGSSD